MDDLHGRKQVLIVWNRGGQTFSTEGHIEDFIATAGRMLASHVSYNRYNRFENLKKV